MAGGGKGEAGKEVALSYLPDEVFQVQRYMHRAHVVQRLRGRDLGGGEGDGARGWHILLVI